MCDVCQREGLPYGMSMCNQCATKEEQVSEEYLASDCIKCGREFNCLVHKSDTCIYCEEESNE